MWIYGELPKGWTTQKIGDYATIITDYVANGSFASLAQNVTYKLEPDYAVLIRLTDYNNDYKGDFVYIDRHAYEFLAKSKLFGDEIIISNVGANVGTVFKCPKLDTKMSLAPNSIMLKTKGNDDFYYYWFISKNGQHSLQSIVTGSAQPKFNKTNFRDLEVPVPPLDVQNKIADYLLAIDNKISLNKQINDNLLQQLDAFYHEIFDNCDIMSSCAIGEYFDISIGKTPPRKEQWWFSTNSSDVRWVSISDMGSCGTYINKTSEYLTQKAVDKFNVVVVPDNTVILSFKLTVGRLAITDGCLTTNEAIAHFKTNNKDINPYLYFYLRNYKYETLGSTSSIATAVNSKIIKNMPFLIPHANDLYRFNELAIPLMKKIKFIECENRTLSQLRDSLLPKLMSGEIDVDSVKL